MKESYELLGLSETASTEEIEARYRELKAKYNEEKWQDGEAGSYAARMLGKLDAAYEDIMDERRERGEKTSESGTSAFDDVASAIRSGDLSRASCSSTPSTSAMRNGTICNPSFSIRRIG